MSRTITDHEMERRGLIAQARMALLDAMGDFTGKVGEMTAWEWSEVLSGIESRFRAAELADDWKQTPDPSRGAK